MTKKALYIMMVMAVLITEVKAQAQIPMITIPKKNINIGIKAGFNSTLNFTHHIHIGEHKTDNISHNYKVGYTAIFFTRFNLKKHHYIQPELSVNITKGSISVNNAGVNKGIVKDDALVKTEIHSLDLPIFYGYKFVDKHPYGMSFFVGPKIAWFYKCKNEYSNFYQENIHEELRPINVSAVVGFGVNVSNIYFDFRFETGLHDISKYIVYDKENTEAEHRDNEIKIHRRRNVISFAIGAIF